MATPAAREFVFTRVFDAPRSLIFKAWTDRNTVTFAEHGGRTAQTSKARTVNTTAGAAPYLEGMDAGWTQSLERLGAYVANA